MLEGRYGNRPRLIDPAAQERGAPGGEQRRVIFDQGVEADARQLDDSRRRFATAHSFIADVVVGEREAGFFIIGLLRQNAVQTDIARTQIVCRRLPYFQTVAQPAQLRLDDIEAHETEAGVVSHRRQRRHRLAFQHPNQKAVGIGAVKAFGVVVARIPSFSRRPTHRHLEFAPRHPAHPKTILGPFHAHASAKAQQPAILQSREGRAAPEN